MLEILNRLANGLLPARNFFLGLAFIGLLAFVGGLLMEGRGEQGIVVIPSLILSFWGFSVFLLIRNFAFIPGRAHSQDGFFRRTWQGGKRAWYWLVGLLFLVTSLAVAWQTIRLMTVWIRNFF